MAHNHTLLASAFSGWGATSWVYDGWAYFLLPGECCLRLATESENSGSPPGGFSYGIFGAIYGDEHDPVTYTDLNAQMCVDFGSWQWWGPRNRYYDKFRDGIGKKPSMVCGEANPETDPMFANDPDDGSSEIVFFLGAVT